MQYEYRNVLYNVYYIVTLKVGHQLWNCILFK